MNALEHTASTRIEQNEYEQNVNVLHLNLSASPAPCVPTRPQGSLDCVTNSAWLRWDGSKGAESYTVLAVGNHGHNASCTSSEASCNVPDLECGTIYTFYVSAVNSHCHSNHSDTFELESGTTTLHHMCD